jgi:hypothetical protein
MAKESEVKFGDEGFPMKRIPSVSANEVHSNQSSHEPAIENRYGRDEADMARFGKKQQLKVSRVRILACTRSRKDDEWTHKSEHV